MNRTGNQHIKMLLLRSMLSCWHIAMCCKSITFLIFVCVM